MALLTVHAVPQSPRCAPQAAPGRAPDLRSRASSSPLAPCPPPSPPPSRLTLPLTRPPHAAVPCHARKRSHVPMHPSVRTAARLGVVVGWPRRALAWRLPLKAPVGPQRAAIAAHVPAPAPLRRRGRRAGAWDGPQRVQRVAENRPGGTHASPRHATRQPPPPPPPSRAPGRCLPTRIASDRASAAGHAQRAA